jgi:hypothetical protein
MIVLNFADPLTPEHISTVSAMCGRKTRKVILLPVDLDDDQPFIPQVRALVESVGMPASDWQSASMVINLPADPVVAAVVLSEIAGRRGRSPNIIRWKSVDGAPDSVEPAEVISLHEVRRESRQERRGGRTGGSRD